MITPVLVSLFLGLPAASDSATFPKEPTLPGSEVLTSRTEVRDPGDLRVDSARLLEVSAGRGGLAWEQVVQELPSAISDEDGRLHVRGESGDGQILLDGIPVLGSRQRVLMPLPDPRLLQSVDVRSTSAVSDLPFGSPVFAARTRDVADREGFAGFNLESTSASSQAWAAQAGGSPLSGWGALAGFSGSSSDRFLDPALSMSPYHTSGQNLSGLGKIEGKGEGWTTELLGWAGNTGYDVPRRIVSPKPENQRSISTDAGIGLSTGLDPFRNIHLAGTLFAQQSDSRVRSNGLRDISNSEDLDTAIADNDRMFVGADRHVHSMGGSFSVDGLHSLLNLPARASAGFDGQWDHDREFTSLGIVDSTLVDSATDGDPRLAPYLLTRTGTPFRVHAQRDLYSSGIWAQEQVRNGPWDARVGVRLERLDAGFPEWYVCPQAGLSWSRSAEWVFWGNLGRSVTRPPMEYLLVSSSPEAVQLAGSAQTGIDPTVQAQVADHLELGTRWRPGQFWDLRSVVWGRWDHPGLVTAELGNSGILFPLNLRNVLAGGLELTVGYDDKIWKAHLSGAVQGAAGIVPDDGSSPVTAGLIFGEEGGNYRHPWKGEDIFPLEHNQIWTAKGDVRRNLFSGTWLQLGVRADAGLPFDLSNKDGSSLDEAQAKTLLKSKGYSDQTIALLDLSQEKPGSPDRSTQPRVLFDASAGWDTPTGKLGFLRLDAGVRNILDTDYLTRFETSMGGMHWGEPRTWFFTAGWNI